MICVIFFLLYWIFFFRKESEMYYSSLLPLVKYGRECLCRVKYLINKSSDKGKQYSNIGNSSITISYYSKNLVVS